MPIGGLYGTYHLLREPGNSILTVLDRALDRMQSAYGLVSKVGGIDNSKKLKEQELEERSDAELVFLFLIHRFLGDFPADFGSFVEVVAGVFKRERFFMSESGNPGILQKWGPSF